MSATTNINYENLEKSWDWYDKNTNNPNDIHIRTNITRTYACDITIDGGCQRHGIEPERFRCDLEPIFTFLKHKLRDVDWRHIQQSRKPKWGYRRLENEEIFNLLNDGRIINE